MRKPEPADTPKLEIESWERLQAEELGAAEVVEEGSESELAEGFGIVYDDREELACGAKELERDVHRWELDPASAEDFIERNRSRKAGPSLPWRHFRHSDH